MADLGTAVNTAVRLGAEVVSNSHGGGEYSGEGRYFNHPRVAITVSSGDSGYGVEFPAASRHVTAVGGTSVKRASTARGWTETAWSGAWSGAGSGCGRRTVADVSAVADPATGVAVYDSTAYQGRSGWMVFGGTSVARRSSAACTPSTT